MRRKMLPLLVAGAFAASVVTPAFAAPQPPAPGNGGGKSGQCTGPQAERPSSCKSQGGPGDQP